LAATDADAAHARPTNPTLRIAGNREASRGSTQEQRTKFAKDKDKMITALPAASGCICGQFGLGNHAILMMITGPTTPKDREASLKIAL